FVGWHCPPKPCLNSVGNAHPAGPAPINSRAFRGWEKKTPPFASAKRRGRNREEADTKEEGNVLSLPCQSPFSGKSCPGEIFSRNRLIRLGRTYPFDLAARSGRRDRTTVPACHISLSATAFNSFSSCS